jgi:hypothetical protein
MMKTFSDLGLRGTEWTQSSMALFESYSNPDSPREVRRIGWAARPVELQTLGRAVKRPWKELNKK